MHVRYEVSLAIFFWLIAFLTGYVLWLRPDGIIYTSWLMRVHHREITGLRKVTSFFEGSGEGNFWWQAVGPSWKSPWQHQWLFRVWTNASPGLAPSWSLTATGGPWKPTTTPYSQGLWVAADAKRQNYTNRNHNPGQGLAHKTYLSAKLETIASFLSQTLIAFV